MPKTLIKASFIIAFDGTQHKYILDGELVYEGDSILYVGKNYPGEVEQIIDAQE
jgi:cytosine/adenosine deaminase-related metal-dependent hydrolase